jgi:ribosomal protein S18 acetylase RimI-like enzyme
MSAMAIRRASEADLPLLYECDAYSQIHESRRLELRRMVQQGTCLLTMNSDRPLGFAVLEYSFFGNGFIPLVCVAGEHQGKGVGLRLLSEVERQCSTAKLFASANASNERAHGLFLKAGFVRSGIIENLDEGDPEFIYFKAVHQAPMEKVLGSATSLAELPNLGPKSAQVLARAGITSLEQLRQLGAVPAYVKAKRTGAKVSLNLLWALEGAITGLHWQAVARMHRTGLLLALEDCEKRCDDRRGG